MKKQQIIDNIIKKLYAGTIKANDKLLSIREAAQKFQVSTGSIKDIYEKLINIGVIYNQHGKGFYIAEHWNWNIISSPTTDENFYLTKTLEIKKDEFFCYYPKNKLTENNGKWKKIIKFYHLDNKTVKYNMVTVNKFLMPKLKISDIEKSFISWIYNNNHKPKGETSKIIARKAINIEKKILNLTLDSYVIEENIVTFDKNNEIICIAKWIINPDYFEAKRWRKNY